MIRETAWRGIWRRSFLVDFLHCRLKEAIALELGNELLVRDGGLAAALGYDGQIFQIFEQSLVIGNRQNDGSAFAVVVGNIFNRLAHGTKINGNGSYPQCRCREMKVRDGEDTIANTRGAYAPQIRLRSPRRPPLQH